MEEFTLIRRRLKLVSDIITKLRSRQKHYEDIFQSEAVNSRIREIIELVTATHLRGIAVGYELAIEDIVNLEREKFSVKLSK